MEWNPANWGIVNTLQGQNGGGIRYNPGNNAGFAGSGFSSTPANTSRNGSSNWADISRLAEKSVSKVFNKTQNKENGNTPNLTDSQGSANSADLAYLDDQEARLNKQLGRTGTTLSQGLSQLLNTYNKEVSGVNQNRERELERFGLQREDTESGRASAIGTVDSNARTLANSVRRILGLASGSGSSAYQLAAPSAIARDASTKRTGVLENYGRNLRDITLAEDNAKEDFESLLEELADQRKQKEGALRSGIEDERIRLNEYLTDLARERSTLQGGGYSEARAASRPYESAIDRSMGNIDNIFNKYMNPTYDVRKINVELPELRDYMVDRASINANRAGGTDPYSPYGQPLKKKTEEYI